MQCLFSTLLLVSVALAAPEAPQSNGGAAPENGQAPYAPSGWKPSGRLLILPARQVAQVYDTPSTDYLPPPAPSTEAEPATTEVSHSQEDDSGASQQQQQEPDSEHGVYHVLLPDGRLQRVEYTTAPLKAAPAPPVQSYDQQPQGNNAQQDKGNYQQQSQSGKYQQGQFEQQQNYAPVVQFGFPSSFPQPVYQQSQNNRYQVAQSSQSGSAQSSQYQITNSNAQPQKFTQSKSQAQSQYPQQPEYDQGASQNQFNKKQFKQPGQNQNKDVATNNFATESSSRYTNNVNNNNSQKQQQVQAEVVEYRPIYYAQQTAAPQEEPVYTGFVSNVQYKDVEPIATPIYSYNPAPLVRVLRRI